MQDFFEQALEYMRIEVKNMSDHELNSETANKELLNKYKVQTPEFNISEAELNIGSETLTTQNAPHGFRFVHGERYHYASYTVMPTGNLEVVRKLFKPSATGSKDRLTMTNNSFQYKEFTTADLESDEKEQARIKENARLQFGQIENKFKGFTEEAQKFNNDQLPYLIKIEIDTERARRGKKKSALDNMKF